MRERGEDWGLPGEIDGEMREKEEYKKNKSYATRVPYRGKFVTLL